MICRSAVRNITLLASLATGPVAAHAQTDPQLTALQQIAPPTTNETLPVPYGYVDLTNGNLHLSIPYSTVAGPNGRTTTQSLVYNSRGWQVWVPEGGYDAWWNRTRDYGWVEYTGGISRVTFRKTDNVPESGCSGNSNQYPYWDDIAYTDSSGTHLFPIDFQMNCNAIYDPSKRYGTYALDGSGYYGEMSTDSYGAFLPDSMKVWKPNGEVVVDNNGPGGDSNGVAGALAGSFPSINSQATTGYVNVPVGVWASGAVHPITGESAQGGDVTTLTLPDGRKFTMTYDLCPNKTTCSDQTHLGTLTSLTLPTGGTVTFGYGSWAGGAESGTIADVRVTSVSLSGAIAGNCDVTSATGTTWSLCWHGNPAQGFVEWTQGVDITEPQGTNGLRSLTVKEIHHASKTYEGSTATGTPLEEITYSNFHFSSPGDVVVKRDGVFVSKTHYTWWDYDFPMISDIQQQDASGNILSEAKYTFLTPVGTNSHRCTCSPTTHYIDRPFSMQQYGAGGSSGTPVAGAIFNYDETAPTSTSGFGNHSVMGLSWHDDANFGTSMVSRGNLTSVQRMSAGGAYVTTNSMTYNVLGQVVSSTDGNGNTTNHDWYSDSFGDATCASSAQFFFDARVKNALNQQSETIYDSCTGTVHAQKTPNDLVANRAGTVFQYDAGGRVTNTSTPDGGSIGVHYTDGPNSVVTTTVQAGGGATRVSNVYLDGFGRTSKTEIVASAADGGNVVTETQVDFAGAPSSTHAPFTSTKAGGTTTTVYDALHRTTSVSREGVVQSTATYNGLSTTQTDGRGNQTTTTSNLLGQLASTLEAGSSSAPLNLLTEYGYDALGNLASVNQHGAAGDTPVTRSFNYDPLSRLVQARNPESGWVCYGSLSSGSTPDGTNCSGDATHTGYDSNNNLLKKVDARGAATSFSYDKLNRLTARGGSASSSINSCFLYDTDTANSPAESTGLLVAEWTQLGTCPTSPTTVPSSTSVKTIHKIFAYNEVGRVLSQSNCVLGSCSIARTQSAHYALDGSLQDFGNGLGGTATLGMGYDTAGRLSSLSTCGFATQQACSSTVPSLLTFRYSPVGWSKARFGNNIFLNRYFDLFNRVTGMAATPTE